MRACALHPEGREERRSVERALQTGDGQAFRHIGRLSEVSGRHDLPVHPVEQHDIADNARRMSGSLTRTDGRPSARPGENRQGSALVLAAVVALGEAGNWDVVLRFIRQAPYGQSDPLYGKGIGFYLFSLPALRQPVANSCLVGTVGKF
jgi:hypothetical protein